ncbi:oxygenase MpaB family protein [Leifsonia sp. NPDC080035]|uniref:Oxygenase MpaB family protein n=1 Tax=Leifsonia sp. NPDC080035 TaxID=3143936 RepID=A0AAU7GFH4_9MICO
MDTDGREETSPLRRIAAESLVVAGGGCALLLQIAHPAIGRGVAEHSDFANRVMDRFHATMVFLTAGLFATPEEFATVRRRVNRAHVPVRGTADGAGPAYNAFDPSLQLWVSATIYHTMMDLYARVHGPLEPQAAEEAYNEFRELGVNLQVPPERWPATLDDFDVYWQDMIAGLRVNDATLAVSRQILYPRGVPGWMRLLLPDVRLVTAGLLPASVRESFGLPWTEKQQDRFERRMRLTAAVYPRLPARLRHASRDAYLRRLRRAARARPGATGHPDPSSG